MLEMTKCVINDKKIKKGEIMFDELTKQDIENMQKEIDYRKTVVRADLHEKIMAAKEFGDFSENSELHETRRAKGRNESRISYLENMIRTARIVEHTKNNDKVGLGSVVTVELDGGKVMTYQITTTISQDAQNGKISVKSPFAKAVMGKKVGDRVKVVVSPEFSYFVKIQNIQSA